MFIEAKDNGSGSDNWSYKSCKAPVKSSPSTNQHPVFLQAGCSSCHPTNSVKELKGKWKKRSGDAGCSKAKPKIFAPSQTPFPGARDGQNLISWRWSLPLPIHPVWWASMHVISSYRGNRPTHTHTHTHRQDWLQYTAAQLERSVNITFHGLAHPKLTWGSSNLSLTTNSSWLPWWGLPCLSSALRCQYPSTYCRNQWLIWVPAAVDPKFDGYKSVALTTELVLIKICDFLHKLKSFQTHRTTMT